MAAHRPLRFALFQPKVSGGFVKDDTVAGAHAGREGGGKLLKKERKGDKKLGSKLS